MAPRFFRLSALRSQMPSLASPRARRTSTIAMEKAAWSGLVQWQTSSFSMATRSSRLVLARSESTRLWSMAGPCHGFRDNRTPASLLGEQSETFCGDDCLSSSTHAEPLVHLMEAAEHGPLRVARLVGDAGDGLSAGELRRAIRSLRR